MSRAPMPDTVKGDEPMPSSFDNDLEFWEEGWTQKLWRRLKEEPLIPVGLGLTCYALYGATRSIRRGDKTRTNMYFRARVYAQAFTLLVLCVGSVYWKEDRQKRKHYEGLLGDKRAAEKRDAWIKELEARDEEDERERKRRAQRREDIRAGRAIESSRAAADGTGAPPSVQANSVMSEEELRKLALDSRILAPAMWLWRSKPAQDDRVLD